jgi:4-hydroxybenzoate polyprenyltransferase
VERAAFAMSVNEAWMLLAAVAFAGFVLVWFFGRIRANTARDEQLISSV